MTREEAIAALNSRSPHHRLKAARALADLAEREDAPALKGALAKESVPWVRAALERVIEGVRPLPLAEAEMESGVAIPPEGLEQLRAEAVHEATTLLLHEIAPLVGAIRLHAAKEIQNQSSKTIEGITALESLLEAIAMLRNASKTPSLADFDLADTIRTIAADVCQGSKVDIQFGGPTPFMMTSDKALIRIAIGNAIRNAIEATETLPEDARRAVIITWEATATDYWIVVLDSGGGLGSVSVERLCAIGTTTKLHHYGMGLAAAQRAIQSLGGNLVISGRELGVHFEARWPKPRRIKT